MQTFALCAFSACYHPDFREEEQTNTSTGRETGEELATSSSEIASSGGGTPECGNEIVEVGEGCDAGVSNANEGACTQTCKQAQCGDGFLWVGMENCDPGIAYANQNMSVAYHVCNPETCSWQGGFCGDGLLQEEEICDPGIDYLNQNVTTNYHICDPNTCVWQGGFCGDGKKEGFEECDNGNANADHAGCTLACNKASCGDGFIWEGIEQCELGIDYPGADEESGYNVCTPYLCEWKGGTCGDGVVQEKFEECDDGNELDNDGCESNCTRTLQSIITGGNHTCALWKSGKVRCWGLGWTGQLGYGNEDNIGDDEFPFTAGDVLVGGLVTQIATGRSHTCALLETGQVRCWGFGWFYGLGYKNKENIGDDETPVEVGNVYVGGNVVQIAAGDEHTCALLEGGKVRCWGNGENGRLGYGNTNSIGDNEHPFVAGDVSVGGTAKQLTAGFEHTCALLEEGKVRCWGPGYYGALGYGNKNTIGDNEFPKSAGDVPVGDTVVQIDVNTHTCVLLTEGQVKCWGSGSYGQLGYGNTQTIGDDETPDSVGNVQVGDSVIQIATGGASCALLEEGNVRCWGDNLWGQLGYGNAETIGDDEHPFTAGDVPIGGKVVQLTASTGHTCALLANGQVRCWGLGQDGQLGYGNVKNIGDDETPASAGDVPLFDVP